MAEFQSWRDYHEFRKKVKNDRRFVRDEWGRNFLQKVRATAEKRAATLHENTFVWRSQLGHDWKPYTEEGKYIDDVPAPFPPDRMTPLDDRAKEGRANPKGVPYLYVATTQETAMAEAQPGVGALISLAQFRTKQALEFVDCASEHGSGKIYLEEPEPEEREKAVWADINQAFSKPVTRNDDVADYAPTQILAELFKSEGYDGVVYKSSLADGHNLVLFDVDAATLVNCVLCEAKSVAFQFKQVSNRYFIHEDLNDDAE